MSCREALRSEHAQLQLHFQAAEKTTSAQRELRDTTIARLQGELEAAVREREATRREWESTEAEVTLLSQGEILTVGSKADNDKINKLNVEHRGRQQLKRL